MDKASIESTEEILQNKGQKDLVREGNQIPIFSQRSPLMYS